MNNFNSGVNFITTRLTNFLTLGINAKEDYTKLFELSLGISKVSLLIIFIVVTLVYQIKYNKMFYNRYPLIRHNNHLTEN